MMGFPMTWGRLVHRNHLLGGYNGNADSFVKGDMRRFEQDTLDPRRVMEIATLSEVSLDETRRVLVALLRCDYYPCVNAGHGPVHEPPPASLPDPSPTKGDE